MSDSSDDESASPRDKGSDTSVPVMDYEKRIDSPRIPRKRAAPEPPAAQTNPPREVGQAPAHTRHGADAWNGNGNPSGNGSAGPQQWAGPSPAGGGGGPGGYGGAPGGWQPGGGRAPPSFPQQPHSSYQYSPPRQQGFHRNGPWQGPPPQPQHYPMQRPWQDQRWQQPPMQWQVDRRGAYGNSGYGWPPPDGPMGGPGAWDVRAYNNPGGQGDLPNHAYQQRHPQNYANQPYPGYPQRSPAQAKRPRNSGPGADGGPQHGPPGVPRKGQDEKMSFKDFLEYLPDDVTPEAAQARYEDYCSRETNLQPSNAFFAKHSTSAWFREKYHPDVVLERANRIQGETRKRADKFKSLLEEPTGLDKIIQSSLAKSGDERKKQEEGTGEQNSLFLRNCPATLTREKLVQVFKSGPKGDSDLKFVRLRLGEPVPSRGYTRCCWATYESPDAATAALDAIRDYEVKLDGEEVFHMEPVLNLEKLRNLGPPILHRCFSQPGRMDQDLAQAEAVARHLDDIRKLGKDDNPLTDDVLAGCSVEKRLDAWVAYLRNVHMYIYYNGGNFCDDPPLISDIPRRVPLDDDTGLPGNGETFERKVDEKSTMVLSWKVDRPRNGAQDAEQLKEEAMKAWLDKNTIQEKDDRFRCALPPHKLFRGPEFVHKHLKTKHADAMRKVIDETLEKCYQENYVRDPNHFDASSEVDGPMDRSLHRGSRGRPGQRLDAPRGRHGRHSGQKSGRRPGGRDLDLSPSRDNGRLEELASKAEVQKSRLVTYADV